MSNSDDETLSHIKQTKPSKFCFADDVGPSNAPPNASNPSTPGTDSIHVTTTPSSGDLHTDKFNFALSKTFFGILGGGLTSEDAILKEVRE